VTVRSGSGGGTTRTRRTRVMLPAALAAVIVIRCVPSTFQPNECVLSRPLATSSYGLCPSATQVNAIGTDAVAGETVAVNGAISRIKSVPGPAMSRPSGADPS